MSLLALLWQPVDQAPEAIGGVDVAWSAVAPILVLVGGALLLLAADSLSARKPERSIYALWTTLTAAGSIAAALPLWERVQDADRGPFSTLRQAIGVDGFSVFATVLIGAAVILSALLLDGYLRREGLEGSEPYVLLLLSASGGVMMAGANDLIVMFLGLEILSIAVYVLAAMHLRKITSQEAGVKYFVLGAFSSAFFLYGIAMIYGGTGTTNLVEISSFLAGSVLTQTGLVMAGLALLLVGFAFKVSAVPFHFWTPDVYQGAPSPSVAWMASGVKVAGFAGMLRVFYLAFGTYRLDWQPIVYAVAAITMVVGSVMAVVQTDVKRMLAYSSINHAGFVLVAVQAASERGVEAVLFYL
ncbi:MAG: NADH-quinone oxidoreductase subunit N, partial [Acidimicrobiales bacterium]|nr:NADH-quinone oxidoreductase subunit N [Acidimicrobiales bacterium]